MAYTTIKKPSDYFNTKLYTGNGTLGHAITGVGHQPDFVWIKNRDAANRHTLHDVVRGVTNRLRTDGAEAEDTTDPFTSFDSDGFTLNSTGGGINGNTENYVSWNWKAGTTGSGTTGGSGTAKAYSYSVNTTAGFSIVKYAGNGSAGHTIPHHLGAVPKMIIVKDLTDNEAWRVYHASTTDFRYYLELNTTAATVQDSGIFDNVPTSSGFLVGSNNPVNNATHDYIAYCFAEKTGYSKFGSYVGNGSTDGTFIYTGFKPAFVIYKGASGANAADNWEMADNKRSVYNGVENVLYPNLSNAEGTGVTTRLDLLSNGFKMRTGATDYNGSGQTYIYIAFAEEPLVGDNPATAR